MTRILLALLTPLFLIPSFPLFDLEFLSWIAFVPLFLTIRNKGLKSTLGLCFLSGFCFFSGVFYWINLVKGFTPFHFLIIMLYLALYFSLFGLVLNLTSRRWRLPLILTAPALWVSTEYLRAHAGFMELPLGLLGHSQYHNSSLLQMASFTGVYGISFIIMLVNAAIADLIGDWIARKSRGESESISFKKPAVLSGAIVLLVILIVWVAGYMSLPPSPSGKPLSVAVIQGNIPQDKKWDPRYREYVIAQHENLSEIAMASRPQIIVWPEASTPGYVLRDITLYQRIIQLGRRSNTYMLIGSAEYPKFDKEAARQKRTGNTALFFSPEGKILGQYLKMRLLPFGEYIPFDGIISWPRFIIDRKKFNANVAGTKTNLFELDGNRLGTLICWEIMFPELSRRFVREGAEALINISNEAWFGESAFPYQFLSVCVFRAVENRVNLVRATNTGVSCFIDPYGRITGRVMNAGKDIFVEGTLTQEIFLTPPGTFYTRYGDVFAYSCIAFSIGLLIYSASRKRQQKKIG